MTSDERKEQILNNSLGIIHEKGFSNLTIHNISLQIGISQAAIYRHFKDKHQIVASLAELALPRPLITPSSLSKCDPAYFLQQIICGQIQQLGKTPYLTAITFQEESFHEYPDIKEKFISYREEMERVVTASVRCGQKRGVFLTNVDPQTFAIIYVGSIRMAVQKWRSNDFSHSLIEECRKITTELFKLLEERPAAKVTLAKSECCTLSG